MNGIRSIVLLGLLTLVGCAEPRPNVLIVILDTTRADHLSCYGYDRQTTPNLDRLAAEGERYEQAWSSSPWTLPSIATILTGQPPHAHGAGKTAAGLFPLRDDVTTLADRFVRQGYRTGAWVNVVWCQPRSGLNRGFDTYDFQTTDASNLGQRDAKATTDAALAWLDELDGDPFFAVVHYFDPHLTYDAPEPFATMFEGEGTEKIPAGFGSASEVFDIRDGKLELTAGQQASLIARYDGELRYTDEQFGRLREGLEQAGLWNDTLVIVVGDHGEEFRDHGGFEHGHSHHREMLRVPLIVRRPDTRGGAVRPERVRLIDIAPTVLELNGIPGAQDLPGSVLGMGGPGRATYAIAEGSLWAGDVVSVRADAGTLILDRGTGTHRYFAATDTFETGNRSGGSDAAAGLLKLLRALPPERSEHDVWEPTPEQRKRLESLGYLR